ncbi:MAG TPA: lysine-sensitive aspartokinase 3 [Candidatus Obscuribacterales bacterium]
MLVMKFGGTSVGSADRFTEVLAIVRTAKDKSSQKAPLVVLSAMSGVTNSLIRAAELAAQRDLKGALAELASIREKHANCLNRLLAPGKSKGIAEHTFAQLQPYFEELEILLKGVSYLGELSPRSLDAISGAGELLSSKIFFLFARDKELDCQWIDAREVMVTDDSFGKANPLADEIEKRSLTTIDPLLKQGTVVVTQGFIGATKDGISTTLGRGGSDYSASIFGAALKAEEIQIWTDVDGMMTADPRLVPEATVIEEVGFQEASELAYFGAKVLHPLTIKPAIEKGIPVRILNTLRPEGRGTIIISDDEVRRAKREEWGSVCAIAAKKGISALFISSPKMLMAHGFLAKVFQIFDRHKTSIDLIATSEVSVSLTLDQTERLQDIVGDLREYGEVKVMNDLSIVTVVGRQFRDKSGIAGEVFSALKDINIIMISGGASDINLSFVVSREDADKSIKQLHRHFFKVAVKT